MAHCLFQKQSKQSFFRQPIGWRYFYGAFTDHLKRGSVIMLSWNQMTPSDCLTIYFSYPPKCAILCPYFLYHCKNDIKGCMTLLYQKHLFINIKCVFLGGPLLKNSAHFYIFIAFAFYEGCVMSMVFCMMILQPKPFFYTSLFSIGLYK